VTGAENGSPGGWHLYKARSQEYSLRGDGFLDFFSGVLVLGVSCRQEGVAGHLPLGLGGRGRRQGGMASATQPRSAWGQSLRRPHVPPLPRNSIGLSSVCG
jgi:hypothetical protein